MVFGTRCGSLWIPGGPNRFPGIAKCSEQRRNALSEQCVQGSVSPTSGACLESGIESDQCCSTLGRLQRTIDQYRINEGWWRLLVK